MKWKRSGIKFVSWNNLIHIRCFKRSKYFLKRVWNNGIRSYLSSNHLTLSVIRTDDFTETNESDTKAYIVLRRSLRGPLHGDRSEILPVVSHHGRKLFLLYCLHDEAVVKLTIRSDSHHGLKHHGEISLRKNFDSEHAYLPFFYASHYG